MDGSLTPKTSTATPGFLEDVVAGLSLPQKNLSPKWLYDQRGSALFEDITSLPEYYLTRTETGILTAQAAALAGLVPQGGALIEFGSGASVKTRTLLDAGSHFGAYVPMDISEAFLMETAADLKARYPDIPIVPLVGDFTSELRMPPSVAEAPKVGFFPGSTIGNLPTELAVALLAGARRWPNVERFILGADLVKNPGELVAAYDDSQGVTAEFIANILRRINAELMADFDLGAFRYEARWSAVDAAINMRLISMRAQTVALDGRCFDFEKDEPIHVSSSRKFTEASLRALVGQAGWQVETLLTDPDQKFAVTVLKAS